MIYVPVSPNSRGRAYSRSLDEFHSMPTRCVSPLPDYGVLRELHWVRELDRQRTDLTSRIIAYNADQLSACFHHYHPRNVIMGVVK
jgi:hypothetical protein